MSKDDSTRPPKPAKPSKDFPLYAHASGRWCKKIRGRIVYFGKWEDGPDAALNNYLSRKNALHSGVEHVEEKAPATIRTLCGDFLTTKEAKLRRGSISIHTYDGYAKTCKRLQKHLGNNRKLVDIGPRDFERMLDKAGAEWGPVTLKNEVNRVDVIFNFALTMKMIAEKPTYGELFQKPEAKELQAHRNAKIPQMFEPKELRKIIAAADQPLKSMILLGINGGFGNSDVGNLPISAVDLKAGWIAHPRPKTAVMRRVPLWPETVKAIKAWLRVRPEPKLAANANLVFVTSTGGSWFKTTTDNPISKECRKLFDSLGIGTGRNFYALRHTFQTIADDARDFVAVRKLMGHKGSGDIANEYRERISDDRLKAVTDHVRGWLFRKGVQA